jgi:hypothetical protein
MEFICLLRKELHIRSLERGKEARKEEVWTFILINLQYNNRNAHGIALAMRKNTNFFRVDWKAIKGYCPTAL